MGNDGFKDFASTPWRLLVATMKRFHSLPQRKAGLERPAFREPVGLVVVSAVVASLGLLVPREVCGLAANDTSRALGD